MLDWAVSWVSAQGGRKRFGNIRIDF
uniref:Uncharacterized protein n=1 Tax=Arundo donax TaxID=35708 RepID=A0A0A9BHV0_ARUDO